MGNNVEAKKSDDIENQSENDKQKIGDKIQLLDCKRYDLNFLKNIRANYMEISEELFSKINDLKINLNRRELRNNTRQFQYLQKKQETLHCNFLMDENLMRLVEYYNQQKGYTNAGSSAQQSTAISSQWQKSENSWITMEQGIRNEVTDSSKDYLADVIKTKQISNELNALVDSVKSEDRVSKSEVLKKQILKEIPLINARIQELKKNHLERKMSHKGNAQATPGTSSSSSHQTPHFSPRKRNESMSSSTSTINSSVLDNSFKNKSDRDKPRKAKKQKEIFINGKVLSKESHLILSLLSLDDDVQRQQYLVKVAKERSLLQRNPYNDIIGINPRYGGVLPIIKNDALQNIECMAPCVLQFNGEQKLLTSERSETSDKKETAVKVKVIEKKIKNEYKNYPYEEQIMLIVNDLEKLPEDVSTLKYVIPINKKKRLTPDERQEIINEFVKKLVDEGKGHLHVGELRINNKNYLQAFVNDKESKDVFLGTPCIRKYALQHDLVEIYVHHGIEVELPLQEVDLSNETVEIEESAKPVARKPSKLGFVTKILEKRHNRKCIGTFSHDFSKEKKSAKFKPRDIKMPLITIPKQNWPTALITEKPEDIANVLYIAEIIDWNADKPIGNILQSLGNSGELAVENKAILVQNSLDTTPFSDEIIALLPPTTFTIPPEEIKNRLDLRKQTIFTIDPLTARDLDDALSCRKLENGNYEVGVHISDVSYFLQENSELDEIVKQRATSIYMVDTVYHMLPKQLCLLCSLLPGEDKLAFSVFWEMTHTAEVVKTTFHRTIVNSCTQFAYEHAQKIIDQVPLTDCPTIHNGVSYEEIRSKILILTELAKLLRAKRMDRGALKIDQPKLSFRLDPDTGLPVEYKTYELKEANRMIEDWMLLANCSVAKHIHEAFPETSILRAHSAPNINSMDNLEGTLKKYGFELTGRDPKQLRETMQNIVNKSVSRIGAQAVLNVLLSKPMQRAKYFCSGATKDFRHFALAVDIYTHFTSPIRRYPDVMVHRALSASLKYTSPSKRTPEELQSLAEISNTKKWAAKTAGEECSELYFRTYLTKVGSIKARAAIMSLGPYSAELVLIETGHTLKMHYKLMEPFTTVKLGDTSNLQYIYMSWQNVNKPPKKHTIFSELLVEVTRNKNKLQISKVFPT